MRWESSNEIKCNIQNYAVLQHTKNNTSLTEQNFQFLELPLSTVVVLRQYHKNFCSHHQKQCNSCIQEQRRWRQRLDKRRPSRHSSINSSWQNWPKRAMLIRSSAWSSVTKNISLFRRKRIKKYRDIMAVRISFVNPPCKNAFCNWTAITCLQTCPVKKSHFVSKFTSGVSRYSSHLV